jgi:hypothetical protein
MSDTYVLALRRMIQRLEDNEKWKWIDSVVNKWKIEKKRGPEEPRKGGRCEEG